MKKNKIKTALLSVSNKKKITMLARKLIQKKIKLFATKGTANILKKKKIKVKNISDYIKFPEILKGKIKTLHPKIYGGLLAKNLIELNSLKKYNIIKFDLVIINFYIIPKKNIYKKNFLNTIKNFIDIGGPSIVRASVKNYKKTLIIINIKDYIKIINKINYKIYINNNERLKLAIKAFKYNTLYDIKILNFIYKNKKKKKLPKKIKIKLIKKYNLRYGENQHQKAAVYINKNSINKKSILSFKQIQGLKLSYNNIYDSEIAFDCVKNIKKFGCVIVKHGNPCGAAIGKNILIAYKNAYKTDPISCFGGIIAFNKKLNSKTAKYILKKQFVEIIIAPKISKKTIKILKKKKNIRVLINKIKKKKYINKLEIHSINEKFLIQTKNIKKLNINKCKIVTYKKPTKKEIKDLIFAWEIVKFTKSNSIIYAKNLMTIAIGSGQTSRIDAIKLAHIKAKKQKRKLKNSVLASDAFFPFKDSIKAIAKKKIKCIIQPGGSIRDNEIIKTANKYNIAMIFTNIRNFKH